MSFVSPGNRVAAVVCFCMLACFGAMVAPGCGPNQLSGESSTKPSSTKPVKPTPETISVELNSELGMFAPRAQGVMRLTPATPLPQDLLAKLGAIARGKDGGPAPVLVTIGEGVKYDGAFPGEKSNWAKWDQGLEALVRKEQSSGRPVIYEVWKEPDNGRPFRDRLDFFGCWVHTARKVRQLAPGAILAGPCTQKFDGGWISEFLKVCKEYNVLPDILCWHEDGLKHDINGHIGGMAESFWQDGTNIKRVLIGANSNIDNRQNAGDPAIYMGQMERTVKDGAIRRIEQTFEFKLTHLFTNDLKPRSIYYTYEQYAAMENGGRAVKVNSSGSVDGVAVYDKAKRSGRILLGRNRSRVDQKQILGVVTLQIRNIAGAGVKVAARRIADTGAKASSGPVLELETELSAKNGEVSVILPSFASGDAYSIELTVAPPTSQPATSQASPATKRSTGTENNRSPAK